MGRKAASQAGFLGCVVSQLFTKGAIPYDFVVASKLWEVQTIPHLGTESVQVVLTLRVTPSSRATCLAPIKYCHPWDHPHCDRRYHLHPPSLTREQMKARLELPVGAVLSLTLLLKHLISLLPLS